MFYLVMVQALIETLLVQREDSPCELLKPQGRRALWAEALHLQSLRVPPAAGMRPHTVPQGLRYCGRLLLISRDGFRQID